MPTKTSAPELVIEILFSELAKITRPGVIAQMEYNSVKKDFTDNATQLSTVLASDPTFQALLKQVPFGVKS